MGIKCLSFPSFEEWFSCGKFFESSIGNYYYKIALINWTYNNGKTEEFFKIAISFDLNATSNHAYCIFDSSASYYIDDRKSLEKWYNNIIKEANDFWVKYVKETFLE